MLYTLRFFSSKCSLFHNANFFVSCIIHILYRGWAEIKKKNTPGAKGLKPLWVPSISNGPNEILINIQGNVKSWIPESSVFEQTLSLVFLLQTHIKTLFWPKQFCFYHPPSLRRSTFQVFKLKFPLLFTCLSFFRHFPTIHSYPIFCPDDNCGKQNSWTNVR